MTTALVVLAVVTGQVSLCVLVGRLLAGPSDTFN